MTRLRRFGLAVLPAIGVSGCGERPAAPARPAPAAVAPPVVVVPDTRPVAQTFPAAKVIPLPKPPFLPNRISFTPGSPGAIVVSGPVPGQAWEHGVRVVSLAPGAVPAAVSGEQKYAARRAVSPDLKWLAVAPDEYSNGNAMPIRLVSLADGAEVRTFTPYTGYPHGLREPHLVDFGFVASNLLLTVGSSGGFDVWEVPGFTRKHGVKGELSQTFQSVLARHREVPTPKNYALGGRWLAQFDGDGMTVYDPATAGVVGKTGPLSRALTTVAGASLAADGRRLAVMYQHSAPVPGGVSQPEDVVAVWGMTPWAKEVENKSSYKITELPRGVQWWGSELLLLWPYNTDLRAADVWSLAAGRVVGAVESGPRGRFQYGGPDDLLWGTVGGPAPGGDAAVVAVAPPPFTGAERYYLTRDGLSTAPPGE